jgi:tetratricopeptide (TPR) repeat protein
MVKKVITGILVIFYVMGSSGVFGQGNKGNTEYTDSTEYWRKKAYEARLSGDIELSLKNYLRVLEIKPDDWDANLAVARIEFSREDYKSALVHFMPVFSYDSTNTEALWGIGRCYYRTGHFKEAAVWFSKTLKFMPGHLPLLEDLSFALVNSGQSQQALEVYQSMIMVDSTLAMAWAGMGKIYQLTGKPGSAARYLKRALELDPDNVEMKNLYQQVKKEMAFSLTYQLMYINEQEPLDKGSDTAAYNIHAVLERIVLNKRISDRLFITFSNLIDHSNRAYWDQPDTNRWFDNTYLKIMVLSGPNKISIHAGGSFAEQKATTYGLAWDYARQIKKISLNNTLSAGYDYYYYWNQVGHDYLSDRLILSRGRFVLDASYRYVNVRKLYLIDLDTVGRNQGNQYSITGRYSLFKNPKLTLGIYHQYRDYEYKSSRYWSPQNRHLSGGMATIWYESPRGLYGYISGNMGRDSFDIDQWEISGEIGYNYKGMNFSLGAARFYNVWYENFIAYFSLTKKF